MLIWVWAGSIKRRLASAGKSSFFFEPIQLDLEWSDLLVQLGLQSLVSLLLLPRARRQEPRSLSLQLPFPLDDLRRMDPMLAGKLVEGFLPFQRFERHTGFEFCTVALPLCRHPLPLRLTPSATQPFYLNQLSSFRGTL